MLLCDEIVGNSGADPQDSTCVPMPEAPPAFDVLRAHDVSDLPHATASSDASSRCAGIRVGIPAEFDVAELSPVVRQEWEAGLCALSNAGAVLVPMPDALSHVRRALPAYYIIALAEASSNLSRYDGARFGHRADEDEEGSRGGASTTDLAGAAGLHRM